MTADIIHIDEHRPHVVFEAVCLSCHHRWIAVMPEENLLNRLECPHAACQVVGLVINTGQEIS